MAEREPFNQYNVRLGGELEAFAIAATKMDGHKRVINYIVSLVQKDFEERASETADFLRIEADRLLSLAQQLETQEPQ